VKKSYKIVTEEGRQFAENQNVAAELEDEREIELSAEQEKAMLAAGWIEGPLDEEEEKPKSKGGKA
jgi:hypothetical protein